MLNINKMISELRNLYTKAFAYSIYTDHILIFKSQKFKRIYFPLLCD